jgi:choice-of-anchor A domain-containing protein
MKTLLVLISAALGMAATSSAATYTLQDAFKVGAFIEGDFQGHNSESEGTLVIGGNLTTGQNKYQVSLRDGAQTPHGYALAVGGNITINSKNTPGMSVLKNNAASGAVLLGGTLSAPAANANGKDQNGNSFLNAPSVTHDVVNVSQAFTDLRAMSQKLTALGGTAMTFDGDSQGNNINRMYLNPSIAKITDTSIMAESFYLFSVTASQLSKIKNPLQGFDFKQNGFKESDLFVFNIINDLAGTNVANLKFQFDGSWADNILWNVSDGNLEVTSQVSFTGSLLAPNSTFTHGNSDVNGTIIAKSYTTNGGSAELHPVLFNGTPAVPPVGVVVPEPSSLVVGALLGLGLFRRQRR